MSLQYILKQAALESLSHKERKGKGIRHCKDLMKTNN